MQQRAVFYPLGEGITLIDDAGEATCYVVEGPEKALVIDTVNGKEDLKAVVRQITDKPLVVFNTHGHPDHVFGNVFFEEAYLNKKDWPIHDSFFAQQPENGAKPCPLKDIQPGDTIDLGGRKLLGHRPCGAYAGQPLPAGRPESHPVHGRQHVPHPLDAAGPLHLHPNPPG